MNSAQTSPTTPTSPNTPPDRISPERHKPHWREVIEPRLMTSFGAVMERASWGACRYTGAWIGLLFFNGFRRRREIAVRNVQLAMPGLSHAAAQRIARRSAQNFGMTLCEFLHMRAASPQEIRDYVGTDGIEHVLEGLKAGRGVILLTAHLGNWELMGARAAQDIPLTVVARPSSNAGIQAHIGSIRAAQGIDVISKFDNARASLQVLRANKTLGILPDQHAGETGVLMPFFGRPTRFVTAVARLARFSGAPVVPAYGVRRTPWLADGRINPYIAPPLSLFDNEDKSSDREAAILEGTRRAVAQLEETVRRYPEQWLWMHRRWRGSEAE